MAVGFMEENAWFCMILGNFLIFIKSFFTEQFSISWCLIISTFHGKFNENEISMIGPFNHYLLSCKKSWFFMILGEFLIFKKSLFTEQFSIFWCLIRSTLNGKFNANEISKIGSSIHYHCHAKFLNLHDYWFLWKFSI